MNHMRHQMIPNENLFGGGRSLFFTFGLLLNLFVLVLVKSMMLSISFVWVCGLVLRISPEKARWYFNDVQFSFESGMFSWV